MTYLLILAAAAALGAGYGWWHASQRVKAIHRKHFPEQFDGTMEP